MSEKQNIDLDRLIKLQKVAVILQIILCIFIGVYLTLKS